MRIPASVNRLIDHYGLLDAGYEDLAESGERLKVLREDREPVTDAGSYLIIVDSGRPSRPAWARLGGRTRAGG